MTRPGARTSRREFISLVGATALAGCGYRPGGGDIRWRRDDVGGLRADRVDLAGGTVFAVTDSVRTFDLDLDDWVTGGQVSAYRASDGRERWTESFESELSGHAIGGGGAAAAVDGTLVRLGPGGEQWRASIDRDVIALGVTTDRVYACTTDSALLGVAGGEILWEKAVDATGSVNVGATDTVAAVGNEAGVTALDPDGTLRWRRDDVTVSALRTAVRGVFVVDEGELLALTPDSGETRWSVRTEWRGPSARPTVTDEAVYYGLETLRVLNRGGETRWTIDEPIPRDRRLPVAADDTGVYAATRSRGSYEGPEHELVAFDHDGTRRWSVGYDRVRAGPFLADAGVLVGAGNDLVCHVR